MTQSLPARAIAGCFSLTCFAVAIVSGLMADAGTPTILSHALVAMIIGQIVGWIAASVLGLIVRDAILKHTSTGHASEVVSSNQVIGS